MNYQELLEKIFKDLPYDFKDLPYDMMVNSTTYKLVMPDWWTIGGLLV